MPIEHNLASDSANGAIVQFDPMVGGSVRGIKISDAVGFECNDFCLGITLPHTGKEIAPICANVENDIGFRKKRRLEFDIELQCCRNTREAITSCAQCRINDRLYQNGPSSVRTSIAFA
jgi:hypothetical protein